MNITTPPQSTAKDPAVQLARAIAASGVMVGLVLDTRGAILEIAGGEAPCVIGERTPVPGEDIAGYFDPSARERIKELVAKAASGKDGQTAFLETGGQERKRVLAVSVLPVPDGSGGVETLAFLGRDISSEHEDIERLRRGALDVIRLNQELRRESTAKQMALQALEELSGRLKSVLSAASRVAIVSTSPSGVITIFNPGAVNLLGYTALEMEGRETPLAFLDEAELAGRGKALAESGVKVHAGVGVLAALARHGGREHGEWTLIRKDGSRFAAEVALSTIEGPHGVEGYLFVAVDVSGRKRAEAAMAEREARLRAILDGAADGIMTVDERGVVEAANPAAGAMFGYALGTLAGRPLDDVAPGALDRASGPYGGPGIEVTGRRQDGSTFPMELTVSAVDLAERRLSTIIVRDITHRRKAEEAQRMFTQRLADQQAALERDLRAAAEIQKSLLPKDLPVDSRYAVRWLFEPSATIGGDIFNILSLGPDLIAVYILDVSGHGVPSALVAAAAAQALQFHSREGGGRDVPSPVKVLEALDEEFPLDRFDRYFSLFYLTLDLATGRLVYSSAGHPPALLRRADGGVQELDAGGTVVGLGGLMPFEQGETVLSDGDALVLYTDGLTEYESKKHGRFGTERLKRWVCGQQAAAPDGLDGLGKTIQAFGAKNGPQDDLTVLVLRYGAGVGAGGGR